MLNQCADTVRQGCLNPYNPTEEEVERARVYLQKRAYESKYPPNAPPCPKLYVRRNFKCMSHEERLHVIDVAKKVYENGVIKKITDAHANCWTPYHKSFEGIIGHRWIGHAVEHAMREIDPDFAMPYWV